MKNFRILFILLAATLSFSGFAKRVLKVKGSKVYFSRKGINAKKGQVLSIYDGSYRVGKIKVYSLKGKYGIAKLISGDASKGDSVRSGKRKKRSRKRSSKRRSKRNSFKNKWGNRLYLGAGIVMPGSTDTHEYSSMMVGSLGYDLALKLFGKDMVLMLNGAFSFSGEVSIIPVKDLSNQVPWSTGLIMINSDLALPLHDLFYVKLGFGITSFKQEGEIANHNIMANGKINPTIGSYSDSYFGLNIGPGAGIKYDITDKLSVKLDLTYRFSYFLSASSDSVSNVQAEAGSLPHLNALLFLGYKF